MRIRKISCIFILAAFGLLNLTPIKGHAEIPASIAAPEITATNPDFSENSNIELVGHLGGSSNASFAQGNYVYIAFDFELAVFDLSDPAQPMKVSSTFLYDTIRDIYVAGEYAYIANGEQGLLIFDVSNPSSPTEVGKYSPGLTYAVWVLGGQAYLGSEGDQFWEITILDISIPSAPQYVQSVQIQDDWWNYGHISGLVVMGDTAYVTHSFTDFFIVDLLTSHVTRYVSCGAHGLVIQGDFAYVACIASYLGYVNISIPNSTFWGYASNELQDLVVFNDYVYGVGEAGLDIFDIQNPSQPITITHVDIPNYPSSVALVDGDAVVSGGGGLSVLDTATAPADPTIIGSSGLTHRFSAGGAIQGSYLYLTGSEGLLLADISDPAKPEEAGFLSITAEGKDVAVLGDYAYISSADGLYIVDVSDPSSLMEVGYVNTAVGTRIEVAGSHAYIIQDMGMQIVDVTNPAAPFLQGFYSRPVATDLAVREPYAYVTNFDPASMDMYVVDVSDPMNPIELGTCCAPEILKYVAIEGNYAYLTGHMLDKGVSGLKVVDITDPLAPQEVSNFYTNTDDGLGGRVAISGSNVYFLDPMASYGKQLRMIDVSNPFELVEGGFFNLDNLMFDTPLNVSGRFISIVTPDSNLILLRYIGKSIVGRVIQANARGFPGVSVDAGAGVSEPSDTNGFYRISELSSGTYTLTPTLGGYNFVPVTQTVTLSQTASLPFFAILPEPVSTTLSTSVTTTLAYSDTQNLLTQFEFPANAVITLITTLAKPRLESSLNGYQFTGHAFELSAYQAGAFIPDLLFNSPVTVTIQYSDFDVRLITDESQLELWWWDGSSWQDAIQTCEPQTGYFYDPEMNRLQIPICKTGKYALYGPTHQVYVPFAMNTSLP